MIGIAIGGATGLLAACLALFMSAWVHKQDHFVPIAIFGMGMYALGMLASAMLIMYL